MPPQLCCGTRHAVVSKLNLSVANPCADLMDKGAIATRQIERLGCVEPIAVVHLCVRTTLGHFLIAAVMASVFCLLDAEEPK